MREMVLIVAVLGLVPVGAILVLFELLAARQRKKLP